jgi:hypothetical protein
MMRRPEKKSRVHGRRFVGALHLIGLGMAIASLIVTLAFVLLQAHQYFRNK